MENRSPEGEPGRPDGTVPEAEAPAAARVFRVPRSGRIAAVVLYLLFVVALEFLVLMSFASKRLWRDERMFSDLGFTLPLLLWLLLAVVAGVLLVRTLTSRLTVGPDRLQIRALFGRHVDVAWDEIGSIVAVGRLERVLTGIPRSELRARALQHVLVLDPSGHRLGNISGNLFSPGAQQALLAAAEDHDVDVRGVPQATAAQLRTAHPAALRWWEAWPGAVAVLVVVFYALHHLALLTNWGL